MVLRLLRTTSPHRRSTTPLRHPFTIDHRHRLFTIDRHLFIMETTTVGVMVVATNVVGRIGTTESTYSSSFMT